MKTKFILLFLTVSIFTLISCKNNSSALIINNEKIVPVRGIPQNLSTGDTIHIFISHDNWPGWGTYYKYTNEYELNSQTYSAIIQ